MYAQLDFSEPILTFFLLLSVYWLVCAIQERGGARRKKEGSSKTAALVLAGLSAGIAMSVKIVAVIVFPLLYLCILVSQTRKTSSVVGGVLAFSVPLGISGFGVVGSYNFFRFGTPFETGYSDEFTFHYQDVLRQFGDNLWSFEGSIFLYSPVIVLGILGAAHFYQRFKRLAWLVFGLIGSFFLFYPFTTNELYYGPRYLTPTLPFFMLIAGSWIDMSSSGRPSRRKFYRGVLIFVLFVGIFQQVAGVLVNYHTYYWRIQYALPVANQEIRKSETAQILRATPELPHLAGHFWLVGQAFRGIIDAGGMPFGGIALSAEGDFGDRNTWLPYYGLDLWWCHRQVISRFGLIFPLSVLSGLCSVVCVAGYRVQKLRKEAERKECISLS
jgi:4-amino-4-deoxy-L-arabinose transferase-like glycosyltransferase